MKKQSGRELGRCPSEQIVQEIATLVRTCSTFSGAARRIALAARSAEAGEEADEEERGSGTVRGK